MNATIEHNFKYHPPSGTSTVDHARIRDKARELADLIDQTLPATAGREKASAITNVEQAMYWACAGICRHPKPDTTSNATS
jgi:hypothetical protein